MIPQNHTIFKNERAMMSEGMGLSGILSEANATHVFLGGAWGDGASWSAGTVPGIGSKIYIPVGKDATYDLDSQDALDWIKVDGAFRVPGDGTYRIVCNTYLSTYRGYTEIGTHNAPATIDWSFQGDAVAGDMMEMGCGFITNGRVRIHGVPRIPYCYGPVSIPAGENAITIPDQIDPCDATLRHTGAEVAATWQVGDRILVNKAGDNTGNDFMEIASIDGATIIFTAALEFPHDGLSDVTDHGRTYRYRCYLQNLTSSIEFRSLNPDTLRGHIMFAHGRMIRGTNFHLRPETHRLVPSREEMGDDADCGVDVRYFKATDLGRTRTIYEPKIGDAGNPSGRWAVHFHRTGHWSQNPAIGQGIVVEGNVGWMLTHHDCHLHLDYCSGHGNRTAPVNGGGSGMVCEDDTETGAWTRCIMTGIRGDDSLDPSKNGWPSDMINDRDYNREGKRWGHGHFGDGFSPNRVIDLRECISVDTQNGVHLHQNQTPVRTGNAARTGGLIPDRSPDREGVKRNNFLSNPVARILHETNQPFGWFSLIANNGGSWHKVFHRQRAFHAADFHVLIEGGVSWKMSRHIDTPNYTHNYLYHQNAFRKGGTLWVWGDKSWGFCLVGNHVQDVPNFMSQFGPSGDIYNVAGGLADNTFLNVGAAPIDTGMDVTNHDISTWPAYTFDYALYGAPYGGIQDTLKGWITDGFTGNITLKMGGSNTYDLDLFGPRPMGWSERGSADRKIHTPINDRGQDFNRSVSLTPAELVQQEGAYQDNGAWFVALHFPIRDRLTAELHWKSTIYDVSHLPMSLLQANEVSKADAGTLPAVNGVPGFVEPLAGPYACFPDPEYAAHYICRGETIQADFTETHHDLPVGQSRIFDRRFEVKDADGTTAQFTNTYTITGRGKAPGMVAAPRIHMAEIDVTKVPNGADGFALNVLDLDRGLTDGWPFAWHEGTLQLSTDGGYTFAEDSRGRGILDYMIPRDQGYGNSRDLGHFKLAVTMANQHGSTSAESNVVEVFNQSGYGNIS